MPEKRLLIHFFLLLILIAGLFTGCRSLPIEMLSECATLEDLLEGLDDLLPEAFMQEAFRRLVLRSPQTVTEVGLAGFYNVRNSALNSWDLQERLLTQAFEVELLVLAKGIDPAGLDENTQYDLEVFIWYLEGQVALHPYQWLAFPLWSEKGTLTNQYSYLLMAQQPFRDEADVEDFLDRLKAIGPQIDQLIGYLKTRQEEGIAIPHLLYAEVMEEMGAQNWEVGWKTPFVTVLAVRLQNMEDFIPTQKEMYYERGGQIADEVILPAFEHLMDALYEMAEGTTDEIGLFAQPQGDAAYQALLDQVTTLEMDAVELSSQAETHVLALGEEVRLGAKSVGYDPTLPLQEIFRQARVERDYALGLDIFVTLRNLMLDAELAMEGTFEALAEDDLVMVPVYERGFYEPAALDDSRKAAFYAGFYGQEAHFGLPTWVYHETFPGEHYQITLTQNSDLSLFRKALHFPAFDEGWAVYAEHLAWEMGLYVDDPNANLGRLQSELITAARVVVDAGIHTQGWDAQDAARYLVDYAGMDRGTANEMVLVQIAQPAEAVAGYVGCTFIRDLRETMEAELGDAFDLKAFHTAVLSGGSLPLPLLENRVKDNQ